jgi:secernin
MCDTLCVLGDGVTLFAKNSDRPPSEPQTAGLFPARPARAGRPGLRTQYLTVADTGACSTLLSRPTWLWGAEHGINEHRVAIGNEMIFTIDDPRAVEPALIGMDLVRLGLERGTTAEGALEVITTLLADHGQGGVGDEIHQLSYWSSFLIADPGSAWILETSGATWAARPVVAGAALSNRLTLRRDWTRASADVTAGADVDGWRHPDLPTGFADVRLAAGRAFVAAAVGGGPGSAPDIDARAVVGALRDHGRGPWGGIGGATVGPGTGPADGRPPAAPAPEEGAFDGAGWTLWLHAGDTATTTASMVALLPADPGRPARAWMALGHPCVSVYVPVPAPPLPVPPAVVGDEETWRRFAALGADVGSDPAALATVRGELAPLEERLWDEADRLGTDVSAWQTFGRRATTAVARALDRLVVAGIGLPAGAAPAAAGRAGVDGRAPGAGSGGRSAGTDG